MVSVGELFILHLKLSNSVTGILITYDSTLVMIVPVNLIFLDFLEKASKVIEILHPVVCKCR